MQMRTDDDGGYYADELMLVTAAKMVPEST